MAHLLQTEELKKAPVMSDKNTAKPRINKWVTLGVYLIIIAFTGSPYWGWDGIQGLFYRAGAYEWLCDPADSPTIVLGGATYLNCEARRASINNMYTVAFTSFLFGSAIGGTLMDYAGEKITGITGLLIQASGWALWCLSTEYFPAYYAGAILIGLAADPGYLPLLTVRQLFPDNTSLIMGLTGSVRSLSFACPIIMNMVAVNMNLPADEVFNVVWVYIVLLLTVCLSGLIFFLPRHGFPEALTDTEKQNLECLEMNTTIPAENLKEDLAKSTTQTENEMEKRTQTGSPGGPSSPTVALANQQASELGRQDSLKKILVGRRLWTAVLIVVTFLMRSEFFVKSNKDQLYVGDDDCYTLFSWMNVLSFAPGPLMGWLSDKYTINFTQVLLNIVAIAQYSFVSIDSIVAKSISCVCVLIFHSFVLSALYCFIKDYFPKRHFGKLVGVCDLIGGLCSLLSIPIYNYAVANDAFVTANMLMVILGVVSLIAVIFQWRETEYGPNRRRITKALSSMPV